MRILLLSILFKRILFLFSKIFFLISLTFNIFLTIIQLIPRREENFYEEAIEKYESVESLLL